MTFEETLKVTVREAMRDELRAIREELEPVLTRPAPPTAEVHTVEEAAAIAKVKPSTVRAWIASAKLRATRPGAGRLYRIANADLMACLAASNPGAPADTSDAAQTRVTNMLARLNR